MDVTKLVRNARAIKDNLKIVDREVMTVNGCKIHIPVHYEESGLIEIGSETYILGIFAYIVDDKYYAFNSAMTKMRIQPTYTNIVSINEMAYYEFYFEPGSAVIADKMAVIDDGIPFMVYDDIQAKGRIPWYISYTDKCKLFRSSKRYAGLTVGANKAVMEMISANTCRDPDNLVKYYRQMLTKETTVEPAHVPFNSVIYGATNTVARLVGNYFELGVMSSLINPSTRTERIETILRRA